MGSLLGWLSLSNISILISSLWIGHWVGQPRLLLKNRFLEKRTSTRKFFIPFWQEFSASFWITVSFSLNSSLYQIFRSWKPNFGHRSFKRVSSWLSTTRITQPDRCTCWSKRLTQKCQMCFFLLQGHSMFWKHIWDYHGSTKPLFSGILVR